jgi:predicted nucleotide-binding protein (sugar kinase/HSP70/actin superfamily)
MKLLKIGLVGLVLLLGSSCVNTSTTTSKHVEFKIGKEGFEKQLAKVFEFENLAIGTYITKKKEAREQGVNLTFRKNDLSQFSDSLIIVYSNSIKQEVKANLLHLSDYDYINITFEEEVKSGDLKKINSIKIKKQLK